MQPPEWLEEIAIPRLVGGTRTFLPPGSESDYLRLEGFIKSEFERRKAGKEKAKAKAWLRAVCYHSIMVILHSDGEEDLWGRIRNYKCLERGPDRQLKQTAFDVGLVALFASSPDFLSSTSRGRMADPMWYAFRHYIPPALLIGFNHQYPRHCGRGRDKKGRWRQVIEPALESWIVQQRYLFGDWSFNLEALRGAYSTNIDDRVERLREDDKRYYKRSGGRDVHGDEDYDWDEDDD